MPSPFPGMDPYLEHPGIWPDFQIALASYIRDTLNRTLPTHYYTLQLDSVEIRDAHFGHEVVTLIEILSPSNKQGGADREKYLQKRREILSSPSSLVEVDLLREGERAWTETDYAIALQEMIPRPDYLVSVNRGWKRTERVRLNYQVFPISVKEALPVIPVPLRQPDREPTLDLQYLFEQVYEDGAYRRGSTRDNSTHPGRLASVEAFRQATVTQARSQQK